MRTKVAVACGLTIVSLALVVAAFFLRPDQYQALAGGVQALGVSVALIVAAAALRADRTDRRVDRVLQLQAELLANDLYNVRRRLVDHLRASSTNSRTRRVSLAELAGDPMLSKYSGSDAAFDPRNDARRLIRFFEQANAARQGGVVDIPLFHELIGRQATWEAVAFSKEPMEPSLVPLFDLADWANEYASRLQNRRPPHYMKSWGDSRRRDFGILYRTEPDPAVESGSPS